MSSHNSSRHNLRSDHPANPKLEPEPPSNAAKDPDDWVSGDEPMTGAQASYLKTLSEQAREPEAFHARLTKAEASKRIDMLRAKLNLADGPPHTA